MNNTMYWKTAWLGTLAVLTIIVFSLMGYRAMATPAQEVVMRLESSSTAAGDILTLSIETTDTADSVAALGFDVVFDGSDPNLSCTAVTDGVNCNAGYGDNTARINRVSYAEPLNGVVTLAEVELDCGAISSATIANAQFVNNDLEPIELAVETGEICASVPLSVGLQGQGAEMPPVLGVAAVITLFMLLILTTRRVKTATLLIPLFGLILLGGVMDRDTVSANPAQAAVKMGDTDCDGAVTIVDALLADQYAAGAKTGQYRACPSNPKTAMYLPACDVDLLDDCTATDVEQMRDCDVRFGNQFCNETIQYVVVVQEFNSTSSTDEVSVEGEVMVETADGEPVLNRAFALSTQLWGLEIPVCWVNPAIANATERGWVQQAVADTWEANSQVRFTRWGTCPAENDMQSVRIKIEDDGPHVKELGKAVRSHNEGMVLNFSFNEWMPTCSSTAFARQFCIEVIAVHEFGHALGFAHEQNRPDTPSWCDDEQGTDGDILIGDWDVDSVMNYCNPAWGNSGNLSAGDIEAVQRFYGKPAPASVDTPTVCLEGEVDINDDEVFGNEFAEFLIDECALIAPNTTHTFRASRCAGGEVRVEIEAIVSVASDFTASASVGIDLYEGVSCNTTDYAASGSLSLNSPLNGEGEPKSVLVRSPENGDDWTNVELNLSVTSTGTPIIPTNTPTPPQTVCLEGSMVLNDDESFSSDERGTFSINECSNMQRGTTRTFSVSKCVGGEVRGEIAAVVTLRNDGSASGEVTIRMYEGTSCSTNDLEGTRIETLTTPPNGIGSPWEARLNDSGDWMDVSLFLSVAP